MLELVERPMVRERKWEELGNRIRQARMRLGLTIAALAESVGVTVAAVSFWEQGRSSPNASHFNRLSHVLGVSHDWLLAEDDVMSDEALILSQPELALRKVADKLSPDGIKSIADFIRFVTDQESKERGESDERT